MILDDGYHDVPPGKVATIVTHLEMVEQAPLRPSPALDGWRLRPVEAPTVAWYRQVFHDVGSDWLWFSRLTMPDDEIQSILSDPGLRIWTLSRDGTDGALLELDFETDGACKLCYFGLAPALIGQGAGRVLMNAAISAAWAQPISRFHLHTCTLDSPQALPFYIRSGFRPYRQQIEIADDPRLINLLPRGKGHHIPIFD